ncbi:hypothetical protein MFIFM68171_00117 [Madurella fahalii]|uniref:Cytochrome P450 n=1 Tax=Madurella fahalii TaxID=1157608 RepID=A0ABQ0FWL9_9PEZI
MRPEFLPPLVIPVQKTPEPVLLAVQKPPAAQLVQQYQAWKTLSPVFRIPPSQHESEPSSDELDDLALFQFHHPCTIDNILRLYGLGLDGLEPRTPGVRERDEDDATAAVAGICGSPMPLYVPPEPDQKLVDEVGERERDALRELLGAIDEFLGQSGTGFADYGSGRATGLVGLGGLEEEEGPGWDGAGVDGRDVVVAKEGQGSKGGWWRGATVTLGAISVYAAVRCIYLLYFHPLSSFPGPRIAAVSNTWYAYHWLSGRYPWAIEDVLREYGDVVRIAPNELVFCTPQAFADIYRPHHRNLEVFVKTDFQNRDKDIGGIVWKEDPVRHREVARRLSPAFSNRSIRAMEPLVHEYMDSCISRMKELGAAQGGVGLAAWTNWLAMDLSADLTWHGEMHLMKDNTNTVYLDVLLGFNRFATVIQVFKRFPLLSPFQYFLAAGWEAGDLCCHGKDNSPRIGATHRAEKQR